MRTGFALCGLALGLLSAGCSIVEPATRLATCTVTQCIDDMSEKRRNRQWAEEVWDRLRKETPDCPSSRDYAEGFKEGFADFLYEGGDGEPPPLPPNKYRALRYRTPLGYLAIEDWFAGFRHGAAEARQGGYRKWITGPSSAQSETPVPQPPPGVEFLPPSPSPAEEELPPPRTAKRKDERPGAAPPQPPAPVHVQAQLQRDPPLAVSVWVKDERQGASPARPPAPVHVQAQFRRELNAWQIVWHKPDDNGVRSTSMSPQPFAELMKTVARHKRENKDVGGRHGLTVDSGTKCTAIEVDNATFEDLDAFLTWYYEEPAE